MDYVKAKDECVKWIREWFANNGNNCNAVIGISGGKDSTVAAALCVEALGKDRVIGVAMPDSGQGINEADKICDYLGITCIYAPIGNVTDAMINLIGEMPFPNWSKQSEQNIPPRIRMAILYAISQSFNGRICGTCNLSENWVGYFTRWGDGVSDFEPLGNFTVTEVKGIGHALGIPEKWVEKIPDDGLPNSSPDEVKFGFTYATLDTYLRTGNCEDEEVKNKIDSMHNKNKFKMYMPTAFYYEEVKEPLIS